MTSTNDPMTRPQHREQYDKILAELDPVAAISAEAGRRVDRLALLALAHGARTYADADWVRVGLSDVGDWFELEQVRDGDEWLDVLSWEKRVDVVMRPIHALRDLVRKVSTERGVWIPFANPDGGSWDLDVEAIIRCDGYPERRLEEIERDGDPDPDAHLPHPALTHPAGSLFCWMGEPQIGDPVLLFILIGREGEEPLMRPLLAQERTFAEGLEEYAQRAASDLGMVAKLHEFAAFQVLTEVEPEADDEGDEVLEALPDYTDAPRPEGGE